MFIIAYFLRLSLAVVYAGYMRLHRLSWHTVAMYCLVHNLACSFLSLSMLAGQLSLILDMSSSIQSFFVSTASFRSSNVWNLPGRKKGPFYMTDTCSGMAISVRVTHGHCSSSKHFWRSSSLILLSTA